MDNEIRNYLTLLFGPYKVDGLISIILLYNPFGFDEWRNNIKNINQNYHKYLCWSEQFNYLVSCQSMNAMFQYRKRNNMHNIIYYNKLFNGQYVHTGSILPKHYIL